MKQVLWAPWRLPYLLHPEKDVKAGHPLKNNCIFCDAVSKKADVESLVLYKGKTAFVIMNKYPYANGHLMVIPKRHVYELSKLKPAEHAELGELMAASVDVLKKYARCDGFNLGMNLGAAAGAGIKDHLHYHVVPRWSGDHNFMPVLADVRVVPEHMHATYAKLKVYFDQIASGRT